MLCAFLVLVIPASAGAAAPIELISVGSKGGNGPYDACDLSIQCLDFEASAGGSRAFFATAEQLTPSDIDGRKDVYERTGATTVQVSTGLPGGNGNFDATLQGISDDGTRAFFATYEPLTRDDLDVTSDVYERASEVRLVSTGPASSNLQLNACEAGSPTALACLGLVGAASGVPVYFTTPESLTFDDLDVGCLSAPEACIDVYRRSGDTTTLVSAGTSGGDSATLLDVSRDGTRAFFSTRGALTPADGDSALDIYERAGGTTSLVSTGRRQGATPEDVVNDVRISADGSAVVFATAEQLVAEDTDSAIDLYERAGGTTTLVSTGPGSHDVCDRFDGCGAVDVSADGQRVTFETADRLVAQDTDAAVDVYEHASTGLSLVSGGGAGAAPAFLDATSANGAHVFFSTSDRLVSADNDGAVDVYERTGTNTALVSKGNGSFNATTEQVSTDGSRVVFSTAEQLVPEDTDSASDLYVRAGGAIELLSGGVANTPAFFLDMSDSGGRVFFGTSERLLAADTDANVDVFAADVDDAPPPPEDPPTEPTSPPGSGPGGGSQAVVPPAGAPAGPPGQVIAQAARLAASFGTKAKASRSGVVTLRVRCSGTSACRGRVVLGSARIHTLGSRRFTAAPGRTVAVRVKLTPAGRKSLIRMRRLRATVKLQTLDASGAIASSVKRTVTIVAPIRGR